MMKIGDDYEIVHDAQAPKGRRIIKKGQAAKAEVTEAIGLDAMSDDDIRAEVEKLTGNRPHHRTGRAKLIAEWEAAYGGD